MKTHRASWARSAGGAATLSIVGAAGLALAAPGFAQEERPSPADVMVARQDRKPILEKQDVERLREKCGGHGDGHAIVCSKEDARDPEVRAIVAKTNAQVHETLADVKLDRREMARIRKSVEKAEKEQSRAMREAEKAMADARIHVIPLEDRERLAHMESALAHARAQLKRMDAHRIRADAMRSAMAAARVRLPRHVLTPLEVREIEAAIEEAGRQIERIEIHIDMPDLEHDHFAPPAPRAPRSPPAPHGAPEPPLTPIG